MQQMTEYDERLMFALGPTAFRDLGTVTRHADRLEEFDTCAMDAGPAASPSEAAKLIATATSISESTVVRIVSALSNLRFLQTQLGVNTDDLFYIIAKQIEENAPDNIKKDLIQQWNENRDAIVKAIDALTDDHPLSLSGKAEELTYIHQNILLDSRIITDVRPIFTSNANKIVEAIITHSLVLYYSDGDSRKKIHLSLDAKDVSDLRKCAIARTRKR